MKAAVLNAFGAPPSIETLADPGPMQLTVLRPDRKGRGRLVIHSALTRAAARA